MVFIFVWRISVSGSLNGFYVKPYESFNFLIKELYGGAEELMASCLFSGITVVPVMHLTEKWLSSSIPNEIELFFVQLLIVIAIIVVVAIPVRLIALRK